MLKNIFIVALLFLTSTVQAQSTMSQIGGGCDGCEAINEGQPKTVNWRTAIASSAEKGEPLEITGVIYQQGGKTPAKNVILYIYHTDATGYYTPAAEATGFARRHGHLRGWMKTDNQGRYKFTTVKPAIYPDRTLPAHIHPVIKEPEKNAYYIDEFTFEGDPILTPAYRAKLENRGGSGIVKLTKQNGVWIGVRDIVLGQNIPNYR